LWDKKTEGVVLGDVLKWETPHHYCRAEFEVTRNLTATVGYPIGEGMGPEAAAVAAVQTITQAVVAASGTFTLSFRGRTTAAIAWDADQAAIAAAFLLISNGVVIVVDTATEAFVDAAKITFANTVGNVPDITCDTRLLLTAGAVEAVSTIATTTAGELTTMKNTLTAANINSVLLAPVSLTELKGASGEALRRPFLVRGPAIVNQNQLHLSAGTLTDAIAALADETIQCRAEPAVYSEGTPTS